MPGPIPRTARPWPGETAGWIAAGAVCAFAIHAACYLYFFVDDEAIPLVYARNLLRGRGLTYTPLEGRVEGYSDFLHVLWDAVLLRVTDLMGLGRIDVFDIATAVNIALGIGVVLLTARILTLSGTRHAGMTAGLAFLALAGPLAVWSCSSLETVPFAFAVTALSATILPGCDTRHRYLPAVLSAFVILERIDGFLFVGAIVSASLLWAERGRRRELVRIVVVPALCVTAVYHAARFAYFGTLLSAPLEAKVLFKLGSERHLVVKAPLHTYLRGFVDLYGMLVIPALAGAAIAAWRSRLARAAILAAALMGVYAQTVGDWMFGWRFVVPLLPLVAVVIATGLSRAPRRLQWPAAAVVVVWSAIGAHALARQYTANEQRPLWWSARHLGSGVWLPPNGDLLASARRTIARGDVIAYNQAGLLPFVLDVDNIDDLGICSKFEAELPTGDVYFTDVGRYSPLTNAPVFGAAHAYLLYRNVRVVISRTDLLTNANAGHIPREILGGLFRLAEVDGAGVNALYTRTERDASAYRRDPSLFWQNLAHISRVRRIDVNGSRVADSQLGPSYQYLRWQAGDIAVKDHTRIDIRFADHDEDVSAMYIAVLASRPAVAVTLNLYNEAGQEVASEHTMTDRRPAMLLRHYPGGVRARILSIEADAPGADARLTLTDLRVLGQSAALRDYVRTRLRFPPG